MAYLQLDLDALNLCPVLGPAMGLDGPRALWGLSQLWAWAFRHQAETVPDELVCGFFAGANEPAAKLIAFGFLARESSGVCRIKGAAGRLLLTRRAQSEAGKRNSKNLNGRRATCKGAGGEPELEPEASRETPDGSTPALTPSTKHQEEDQKLLSSAVADSPAPTEHPEAVEPPQASPAPAPPAPKKPAHTPPEALQQLWNERASPALPRALELNAKRRRSAAARLQERAIDGHGGWGDVIERISASAFCRGEKPGHDWRASFDWLLQPDTAVKALEGKYDNPPEKAQAPPERAAPVVQLKAGGREAAAAKGWCSPGLDEFLRENAEAAK